MQNHYNTAYKNYNKAIFYKEDTAYEQWLFDNIAADLELTPKNNQLLRILDLGAGTGRMGQLIASTTNYNSDVVCVDSCESMIKQLKHVSGVHPECCDALSYVLHANKNSFDRVLLKEVVHHINPHSNVIKLYNAIFKLLSEDGICLTCTRPSSTIEYPLFVAALKKWQELQPPYEIYVNAMKHAGFHTVIVHEVSYPLTLDLDTWISFIEQRCWSIFDFSHFSNDELAKGIAEIRNTYDANNTLQFNDKIIFLQGIKRI